MIQPPYNFSFPIVDDKGFATLQLQKWMNQASLSIPMLGTGSPEGVVEARQYQLYLNTSAVGNNSYRKILSDIGGDTTMGWQLQ